ncbi:MAG: entericidin A/B family lipoprotein [Phycisphaerales bacterium]
MDTLIANDHIEDRSGAGRTNPRSIRLLGIGTGVLLGLAAPLALTGCNTTAGVGEDIEATGDAIEDTAEDAQD